MVITGQGGTGMTRKEIKEIVFRTFTDVIADDEAVITAVLWMI